MMETPAMPTLDVYPVGALAEIQAVARAGMHAIGFYRPRVQTPPGFVRATCRTSVASFRRSWRRKSYWNGYLAEPTPVPRGLKMVGHGWTRRRAVRRLERYIAAIAAPHK